MDEALIAAVFKREPLWNPANEFHKNAVVLKRLWREVAVELLRDAKIVKTRWKNLRAYFLKQHRKIELAKNADKICINTWQYYNQLLFLKSCSGNNEKELNFSGVIDDNDSMVNETPLFEEQQNSLQSNSGSETIQSYSRTPQRKKIRMTTNQSENNDQLLLIENKMLEILEKERTKERSDDMLFFESLLPYLNKIPLVRKLRLRTNIQDLILAEIEAVENHT